MGTIQITVALMAITLFTIAIITFATNFASDNNAPIDISDDTDLTSLNTAAQTNSTYFTENASSEYQSIIESTIPTGAQTLQSAAPFTVTPSATVGTLRNILLVGYAKIFGSNSGFNVFLVGFLSLIIIIIGLYLYKTLRGFPD